MPNPELDAREVLDDVVARLDADGYVGRLEERYRKAAEPMAKDLGREPRAWTEADRKRIRFEALVYLSAHLLHRDLPVYLTRKKLLGREPDRERIESFRNAYLRHLPEKLRSIGLASVRVPAGHEVFPLERLREYERPMSLGKGHEPFGSFLGEAMDPELSIVTNIVAIESIPALQKIIGEVLGKRFGAA